MASNRSLGTLTLDLILKLGGFTAGMDKAARDADKRLTEIERRAYKFGQAIGTGLKIAGTAATAAIAGLTALTAAAIDNADAIRDASIQLGISTESLSAYRYAAGQTGTDLDSLSRGLKVLAKNSADALKPTSEQAKVFKALGISVTYAGGNLKQLDALIPEIADRFKLLEDGTTKAALAQSLFGKSGLELTEFLNQGSEGLAEMTDKARELGAVIDTDTAAAADNFNDLLGDLKTTAGGLGNSIAKELLPALNQTVSEFTNLVKQGDLATNVAAALSGVLKGGVWILDQYNNAVARVSIAFQAASTHASGYAEIVKNIASGGLADGSVVDGIKRIGGAWAESDRQLKQLIESQERSKTIAENAAKLPENFSNGPGSRRRKATEEEIAATKAAADSARMQKQLQDALSNQGDPKGTGKTGSSGKTDAQREAEQLQQSYDRLMDSMRERTALIGKEGEAAQVSYELQFGALKGLSQAQKDSALAAAEKYDTELKAFRLAEDQRREQERGIENAERMREDYDLEIQLLGKTIEEQEKLVALRHLGAAAATEQGKAAIQALEDYQVAARDTDEQIRMLDGFRDSFATFFEDAISGTKSVKEAFRDMLEDISAQISRRLSQNWVDQLFGQMGTTQTGSAGGGWLSSFASLFSSNYGGAGGGQWTGNLQSLFGSSWGFGTGGYASAGSLHRVNENGPEVFRVGDKDYLLAGNQGGNVIPNHMLRGGGSMTVIQNFNNPVMADRRSDSQRQMQAARELQKSRRNG